MRVPLEWLKEYVPVRLSPKALAERLTMAGLEVVAVEAVDGQPVLDLEITPNRPDCLSIIGIAREVAALTNQRLKLPGQGTGDRGQGKRARSRPMSHVPCPSISIEDRIGCSRYIGRLLEGVRVGPSPAWMQKRLIACGARPINNVVDITNYVLLERGQPLHAFDFDRLAEGTIVVRRAKAGERLTTLDGTARALAPELLVIADAKQPVAVAGVMGGVGSEVTPATRRVLLESAQFDPVTVRRGARRLGLSSESSYRFERGVDPLGVEAASRRAAGLLRELAGGTETAVRDVGRVPAGRPVIALEPQRLSRWLGVRLEPTTIRATLAQLGCRVASSEAAGSWRVTPPSFRQDLTQAVDLYEELARVTGYDRIPATLPVSPVAGGRPEETAAYERFHTLKRWCAGLGLTEAVTWSLVSEAELARCGVAASRAVRLVNPLSQDHAFLRPSLLPGLLQAVRRNATQGTTDVRLFEVGNVVTRQAVDGAACEQRQLGLILTGWWTRDWRGAGQRCDFWVLKGLLQAVLGRLGAGAARFAAEAVPWAEPGQAATVQLGGAPLGVAGQVAGRIAKALDIGQAVFYAELAVGALLAAQRPVPRITTPTVFPPVKRDLSVLVNTETSFETADRLIREAAGPAAHRVELIDRFTKGVQVPPGRYSLTFSIEYRDPSRTLTAVEADALHQRVGQALVSRLGATLR
jgi:phenylalanyl-tRNA synthetase beta chain